MIIYIIESATTDQGTANAITMKNSELEASMAFHQTLASMMANQNVKSGFCTALNEDGRQIPDLTEYFFRPEQ